jgi:xanthine dehydrogenase small subunit
MLGDDVRELTDVDPTMTVLRYLREVEGRVGTKEGCAEGDCGACTVVMVELDGAGGLAHRAINACIQFLPTLDGKQILTVEDLRRDDGALHPVQQALVDQHGSQCGYCTPGFVMSLYAHYQTGAPTDRQSIDDALTGNLCRCTGYGPIVAAARAMATMAVSSAAKDQNVQSVLEDWATGGGVALDQDGRKYFAPSSVDELAEIYAAHPDATILAGGTDVGLWVTKQHRRLGTVIYLGDVADLKELREEGAMLRIGAGVTYEQALDVITAHYADFGELVRRLGSKQIRNAGTIGGNIANGSPIGDAPPALIALGATLILRQGAARREMPLEDFFVAYGEQDRAPGEFVERIDLPLHGDQILFRCYKISKRFDQDISAAVGAFSLRLEGGVIAEARICFGGMAATPKRAAACEAALTGAAWSESAVVAACAALADDFTPLTDMRASAGYRLKVAQNLVRKFFIETTEPDVETRLVGALAHA